MNIDSAIGLSQSIRSGVITGQFVNPSMGFFGNMGSSTPPDKTQAEVHGGTYAQVVNGARLSTNQLTQNPINNGPNILGLKYFGQSPVFKNAMDMPFPKPVGVFFSPVNGSGSNALSILTNPLLQGDVPLSTVISILVCGTSIGSSSPLLGAIGSITNTVAGGLSAYDPTLLRTNNLSASITTDVSNILGGQSGSLIRLSDKGVLVPFMGALSTAYTGNGSSPFSHDTINQGLSVAFDVKNYLNL